MATCSFPLPAAAWGGLHMEPAWKGRSPPGPCAAAVEGDWSVPAGRKASIPGERVPATIADCGRIRGDGGEKADAPAWPGMGEYLTRCPRLYRFLLNGDGTVDLRDRYHEDCLSQFMVDAIPAGWWATRIGCATGFFRSIVRPGTARSVGEGIRRRQDCRPQVAAEAHPSAVLVFPLRTRP